MKRISGAVGAMAGAASLLAATAVDAQQARPDRDWGGIEGCATIGDAAGRHACLDRELAALGLLDQSSANAAAAAVPTAAPPPVQARAASQPGTNRAANETITYEDSEPRAPVISEMTSTVVSARLDRRGGLEVEAANGTRWRSISSVSLRRAPREGAAFAVEQGALGSYNCRIESSTYFKCERLS